ncbi:MAG: hypothetical protein ACKV2U_08255, partial [Bryobacteraceae bacterium]
MSASARGKNTPRDRIAAIARTPAQANLQLSVVGLWPVDESREPLAKLARRQIADYKGSAKEKTKPAKNVFKMGLAEAICCRQT